MKSLLINKNRGCVQEQDILSTIRMWLSVIGNGEYVLRLERIKKPRTDAQRRLMWLWFTTIADAWTEATGKPITKEMVHDSYCSIYFPIQTPKSILPGQTKDKTADEMAKFLTFVQHDALESYGIVLPDPNDYNFNAYLAEHKDFYKFNQ